jgi:hypothetical protein
LQPYNAGNDFVAHPLWRLNSLGNIDKHRSLHVALLANVGMGFGFTGNTYAEFIEVTPANILRGKTEVARYRAKTFDGSADVNMNFNCSFDVAFANGPANEMLVRVVLNGIRDYIASDVFPPFRSYLL